MSKPEKYLMRVAGLSFGSGMCFVSKGNLPPAGWLLAVTILCFILLILICKGSGGL